MFQILTFIHTRDLALEIIAEKIQRQIETDARQMMH
jgi:hypothetical protein